MAINPILNSVSAALAQQSAAVSVRTSAPVTTSAATTSSTDSSPAQSVVQSASLISASSNIAQLGSLLQVAQQGTEQVGALLSQLQSLAQDATSDSVPNLATLDSEFQALLNQIDQTVSGSTFGGTSLLNGSLTDTSSAGGSALDSALSLPDLSTQGLFGSSQADISNPTNAQATLAAIATGQTTVASATTSISSVLSQLGFASGSIDTVLANNTAASSTLTESDLENGAFSNVFASLTDNPTASAQAQTGNLSGNLLNLLQE